MFIKHTPDFVLLFFKLGFNICCFYVPAVSNSVCALTHKIM